MKLGEILRKNDYPVPEHSMRVGYMLGGIAGFILIFLFITGATMALFDWTEGHARQSVAKITASSLSGFKAAHSIEADIFLSLIFLHMIRIVLTRSYHGARKRNWWSGVILLCLVLLSFYTGITLKWDQQGYEAFEHIDLFTGLFGMKSLFAMNASTKLFFIHVLILPIILAAVLGGHALLIKINGISPLRPAEDPKAGPQTTFLRHMRHVAAYGLLTLGLVHIIAAFYNPPLLGEPVAGVEWTKPAWPLLFLYPMETWELIASPFVIIAILFIAPFFVRPSRKFDASQIILFLLLVLWAALSLTGAFKHFA